jgi:predicted lipoprotein with Yx(FWY)xxD motif
VIAGRWSGQLAALALACLAVCGCGGSSGGGSADAVTVKALELPGYGTVLATAGDQPLYLLTSDPEGSTKCTGACTKEWKPLTAQGDPAAGDGVKGDMLSTFKRSDGGSQVLYNHHALYTYIRPDAGVGAGAGVKSGGGTWYLVDPSGIAIKTTAAGGY